MGTPTGAGLLGMGEGVLAKDNGLGDANGAYDDGEGQLLDA